MSKLIFSKKPSLDLAINLLRKPEWCFVIMYAIFGVLFMIALPPNRGPDEANHFLRAYQVSQGDLVSSVIEVEGKPIVGGYVPSGIRAFCGTSWDIPQHGYSVSAYEKLLKQRTDKKAFADFPNTALYPAINYIAPAFGINLARTLTDRIMVHFYAARICSFLMLGLCLFWSIRIIPRGKWALLALGLLPMGLHAAVSVTADSFTIGVVALLLSYWWYLYDKKHIANHQWLYLGTLATMTALTKQAYFLLAALPLLLLFPVRYNKTELKKRSKAVGITVTISAISVLTLAYLTAGFDKALLDWPGYAPGLQTNLRIILCSPLSFVATIFETFIKHGNDIAQSFLGAFGPGRFIIPPTTTFIAISIILFLFFGLKDNHPSNKGSLDKPVVVGVGVIALAAMMAVLSALYVYWTPAHGTIVEGIQGRYFIPIFIMLIPVLIGRYTHTIRKRTLLIALAIILAYCTCVIGCWYYDLPILSNMLFDHPRAIPY